MSAPDKTVRDEPAVLGEVQPVAPPSAWKTLRSRVLQWLESMRDSETQLSLFLSLLIGAMVGLLTVAFILLTGRLAARMYPPGGTGWRRVLVPTIGALASGFLLFRYFPQARGSGIPQTKAALFLADGLIRLRTAVGKFVCCSVSLASGIALGREGPSVHIGAGVTSVIGRRLGLTPKQVKALVPAGCSAALAAAFNTPIAAVLFSLEEIMGDMHAPVLGSVVVSSATSWMVLHLFLGDDPLFHVPAYRLVNPAEFLVYALLGLGGGLVSVAFVKLLLHLRLWFRKLPQNTVWMQPAIGGLAVGIMGFFVPEVLGVGYDYVERVLNGDVVILTVVLLLILKVPATAVCYSSGNAGGIFGPSLFMGAMLGASIGSVAHALFPAQTADPGAYALIGMGATFAGIVRTPLTSVIMIFELTRDYTIIVPVMISNLIAFFISHRMQREPVYEALQHQDGIHLPAPDHEVDREQRRVSQVMSPPRSVWRDRDTVAEALNVAERYGLDAIPLLDRLPPKGEPGLAGVLRISDLKTAAAAGGDAVRLHAIELSSLDDGPVPHVHPDHTLLAALDRMGSSGYHTLPVVSRANIHTLLGIIRMDDVLHTLGIHAHAGGNDDAHH